MHFLLRSNACLTLSELRSVLHCRNGYKGYALESRLHFRIHSANLKIKSLKRGSTDNSHLLETTLDFSNCNDVDMEDTMRISPGQSRPNSLATNGDSPPSPASPQSPMTPPFGSRSPLSGGSSPNPGAKSDASNTKPGVNRSPSFVSRETSL